MLGLTVTRTTQVDGIVRCEFLRKKTYALAEAQGQGRKKRATVSPSTYFDLNTDWNLLYAYGSAIGGKCSLDLSLYSKYILLYNFIGQGISKNKVLNVSPSRPTQ